MTRESDLEQRLAGMDSLVDEMGASMAEGLIQGLQQSELVQKLMEVLAALQRRLDDDAMQDRLARIERLEKELAALRADQPGAEEKDLEPPPPPRPPQVPPMPPANMPQNPALSSLPFGLSAEPIRPVMRTPIRRQRLRTPVRPTVIYRKDPRASSPAKTTPARPEEERGKECSEPGCDRPVRCRGLCSLHYQRVRYKERKIENKQASDGPLPPPPPPKRRASPAGMKKDGGTRGVFALLYDEKGRRTLAGLINQMKFDRIDLVERLNMQFEGMPGVPLDEEDVLRAIHYHKLGDALSEREGEIICRHLAKQRGSMAKTAQKMKIDLEQLIARVEEIGLQDDVALVRNEFREQIMERSSFSDRLDLALTREKYLKDLAIEGEVDESLRAEIKQQLDKLGSISDVAQADQAICEALALDEQRYSRMVRRYGLEERLQSLVGRSDPEGST